MVKLSPGNKIVLENIAIICAISILYGLVYNWFYYPHRLVEFLEAGTIGFFIGLCISFFELIGFRRVFSRNSFWKVLLLRTFLYSFVVIVILGLVLSIEIAYEANISYPEALVSYIKGDLFIRDFFFSVIFIPMVLIALQIMQLFGVKKFLRLITGIYHRPKEMSRIFMFVDLRDSTSLAEQLSNEKYSSLLKDFFYDISDAVLLYGGEIFQYVGDEMVVVWSTKSKGINSILCFFEMQRILKSRSAHYLASYGIVPEFKAGLHVGDVMVTEVGKFKKDIVYHGDVMNTTSRIEGKCKDLDEKILISHPLLDHLNVNGRYKFEQKGEIQLRGKKEPIKLYGVREIEATG
jgi:adenylate cyclase